MYDYILGGSRNFAADRAVATKALGFMPDLAATLRANRAFLGRVVRYQVESGIRQFLDLGSGIPTVGNVHEIAQQIDPTVRVVYVDIDPIAVLVADEILHDSPNAIMVQADLRHPKEILARSEVRSVLDLTQPVGVLLIAALHLLPDSDDPAGILESLFDEVVPDSCLAISHMSPPERQTPAGMLEAKETYASSGNDLYPRTLSQIEDLLGQWQPQPPGIVACPHWKPDPDTEPLNSEVTFPGYGLLACKPPIRRTRPVTVRTPVRQVK